MLRKKIDKVNPIPCLEVKQGFGTFYVCVIKARKLLDMCEPIRAEVLDGEIDNDMLDIGLNKPSGPQRKVGEKRPEAIASFIKTGVAAFPNSIIIGANITNDGFLLEKDDWQWTYNSANKTLEIEDGALGAAIIDGQHRLQGYELLRDEDHQALDDELVCSVYLDLPITYHAQLFSTINSNQRKVPKT